ncbi:MAG: AAA family ATPase [Bacillota bacterium]
MIKEVRYKNWKSFGEARLYIDPVTIIIGTNASGKSNLLDGLEFLSRVANGKDLHSALAGDPSLKGVRGGIEWAALRNNKNFTLGVVVEEDDDIDFVYEITVTTIPRVEVWKETLTKVRKTRNAKNIETKLFWTNEVDEESPSITLRLYNEKAGTKRESRRSYSVLSQLNGLELRKDIMKGIETTIKALQGIFVLDPIPSMMRSYSSLSPSLASDASNIAGVLAALQPSQQQKVQNILTSYARKLPEGEIKKVWSKTVGEFKTDAMLYCEEEWHPDKKMRVDARGMSDGTLRYLAILTALLTRPKNTLTIIEEVDNGLHPSRAHLLLNTLREARIERNIDILVTTHNPALLDSLDPEMIPFIMVSHRDLSTGESKLTFLEDLKQLPKLMASGSLGKIATQGKIEKALANRGNSDEQ